MKKEFWVALEAIMLIVWVITLLLFLSQIWAQGTKCMSNPLIYGVKALQNENNVSFTCECQFENELDKIIYVDSKHWEYRSTDILPQLK